jgi:hypothetical protein
MAKPIVLDQEWLERIEAQVNGLEYGSVLITVHDGRVVQIDRTERKRFDAANNNSGKQQSERGQTHTRNVSENLKAANG